MRAGHWRGSRSDWPASADREDCAAVAERRAVAEVVIHVLADQATLDGTSDHPGYLPGFGILPAESVRGLATSATLKPLKMPNGAAPGYRPDNHADGVRAVAGYHVPIPRL